jgi:hypothetical protein
VRKPTTREMSDKHERWLAEFFGGRVMRGSGNQWNNPADGRMDHRESAVAWAWDGKSTLGFMQSITPMMWDKIVEQAMGERPMIALRWYETYRLDVKLDLVTVKPTDLLELMERSEALSRVEALVEAGDVHELGPWYEEDGELHYATLAFDAVRKAIRG